MIRRERNRCWLGHRSGYRRRSLGGEAEWSYRSGDVGVSKERIAQPRGHIWRNRHRGRRDVFVAGALINQLSPTALRPLIRISRSWILEAGIPAWEAPPITGPQGQGMWLAVALAATAIRWLPVSAGCPAGLNRYADCEVQRADGANIWSRLYANFPGGELSRISANDCISIQRGRFWFRGDMKQGSASGGRLFADSSGRALWPGWNFAVGHARPAGPAAERFRVLCPEDLMDLSVGITTGNPTNGFTSTHLRVGAGRWRDGGGFGGAFGVDRAARIARGKWRHPFCGTRRRRQIFAAARRWPIVPNRFYASLGATVIPGPGNGNRVWTCRPRKW